ncbi:MAG: hypothetical protein ABL971_01220 [Vicinamibacterales bacterium]
MSILILLLGAALVAGKAGERLASLGLARGVAGLAHRFDEVVSPMRPPNERVGLVPPDRAAVVDFLRTCTMSHQRVFVMGFMPDLYFQTARGFAAGQVGLVAGYYTSARDQIVMVERLRRQDVPYVFQMSDSRTELVRGLKSVASYVDSQYREVGRIPLRGDQELIVLADRSRSTARRARGLPCFGSLPSQS